jgi:hypothetical protein
MTGNRTILVVGIIPKNNVKAKRTTNSRKELIKLDSAIENTMICLGI